MVAEAVPVQTTPYSAGAAINAFRAAILNGFGFDSARMSCMTVAADHHVLLLFVVSHIEIQETVQYRLFTALQTAAYCLLATANCRCCPDVLLAAYHCS
ncbi:hypothetical protein J6590_029264 [Homalodisca vitripennis]|nr:hypothetical protein J6590_029264 [Homalodisca vitripennis]